MKNIHIPNPCPEKWSDMTPTEGGAFCGKCATEVLDFTNKTPEEISETLRLAMGKRVCAKMAPKKAPIKIPASLLAKEGISGFRSRFLFALITVFGITLFSCENGHYEGPVGTVTEYEVGDVEDVGMVEEDTLDYIEVIDDTTDIKIGKVQIEEPPADRDSI